MSEMMHLLLITKINSSGRDDHREDYVDLDHGSEPMEDHEDNES